MEPNPKKFIRRLLDNHPNISINSLSDDVISSYLNPSDDIDVDDEYISEDSVFNEVEGCNTHVVRGVIDNGENLLERIRYEDNQPEVPRLQQVLDGGMIHSTMLADLCVRKFYLMKKYNIPAPMEKVTSNDQLTWNTGRGFEKHVRTQLINNMGVENIFGDRLSCKCEKTYIEIDVQGNSRIEVKCAYCGTSNYTNYHEKNLQVVDSWISGGLDFGYYNIDGKLVFLEIKSMKKEPFVELKKPMQTHVKQVSNYWGYGNELKYDLADYAYVLYVSKGYIGKMMGKPESPYKIFKETMHSGHGNLSGLHRLLDKGVKIKAIIENINSCKIEPRSCENCNVTSAKECPVSGLCFSLPENDDSDE